MPSEMSVGLENPHNGYLPSSGSPGSPPASLADMISRNKMLEGKLKDNLGLIFHKRNKNKHAFILNLELK